jgi:hypothetical protein
MTLLQKTIAIVFLALWLPATTHCSLAKLPGLESLDCCSDCNSGNSSDDSCQTVESGLYKISENSAVVPAPTVGLVCCCLLDLVKESGHLDMTIAPAAAPVADDLPQRWRFILRTALPVRAPSFLA